MPFGRPFRAISLCVSFPGLKPWAVFCSPVGRLELAQENVQTPGPFGPFCQHRSSVRTRITFKISNHQPRIRRRAPASPVPDRQPTTEN